MSKRRGCLPAIFRPRRPDPVAIARASHADQPPGLRWHLLMQHTNDSTQDWELTQAYYAECRLIENLLVGRNQRGIAYEKAGNIDAAIAEYEANVADYADAPHPYDRLRSLYNKRKDYANAVRICEQHCTMARALAKIDSTQRTYASQLCAGYKDLIVDYSKKLKP
jgi:tetratricopeptide (TPR) repeat protein